MRPGTRPTPFPRVGGVRSLVRPSATVLASALALAVASLSHVPAAPAAGTHPLDGLEGKWREVRSHFRFEIVSWGPLCGPRPESGDGPSGQVFTFARDGDGYRFTAGSRVIGSHACLSENREVAFRTFDPATLTTRCSTAADNPKQESARHTLSLPDPDHAVVRGVTEYRWTLRGEPCAARMTEVHELGRTTPRPAGETPPPAPAEASPPVAAAPYPPSRPSSSRRDDFELRQTAGRGDVGGTLGEALGGRGLGAAGVVAGSGDLAVASGGRVSPGLILLVGVALAAAAVFLVVVRFRRTKAGAHPIHAVPAVRHPSPRLSPGAVEAPGPSPGGGPGPPVQRDDDEALRPTEVLAAARPEGTDTSRGRGAAPSPVLQRACPRCGRRFPADAAFCPHDATPIEEPLHPAPHDFAPGADAAAPVSRRVTGATPLHRICPLCATRYPGGVRYCGKDGAELVALN